MVRVKGWEGHREEAAGLQGEVSGFTFGKVPSECVAL